MYLRVLGLCCYTEQKERGKGKTLDGLNHGFSLTFGGMPQVEDCGAAF